MQHSTDLPRIPMLIIAAVQGLLLFALYRATETDSWPSESPLWSYPLWTLVIAVPVLLLLSIDRDNMLRATRLVAVFAAVLVLTGIYTGWQTEPFGSFSVESLTAAFAFSIALACFKALMYLQQRANQVELTYEVLFTNSWRNFLVTALSALFVLVFWLILMLWGQLFKIIAIDFFYELFTEDWFVIPVLTVAFGLGVSIFRALTHVIDNITKLLHWLIKLLLPLVILIAAIFLAALPFVGLDMLWATGNGTALLLWLLALMLFFTNAVYQDGRETNPYPVPIHRAIYVGLCAMPIVAALSFYGLLLRLNQYGWTVERCWAFVVWLVLALFAVGYVVGIVRRRDRWTGDLARVNTAMGLIVLAIMLLANSPVLDFRKISLASQLARVESGDIELQEFDFWYAKHHLARPGYLALEDMKAEIGDSDPELTQMIESPVRRGRAVAGKSVEDMWAGVHFRPEPFDLPQSVRQMMQSHFAPMDAAELIAVRVDLNGDASPEYLMLLLHDYGLGVAYFYYRTDSGWQYGNLQHAAWQLDSREIKEKLRDGDIELVAPRFGDVAIGGIRFKPMASD